MPVSHAGSFSVVLPLLQGAVRSPLQHCPATRADFGVEIAECYSRTEAILWQLKVRLHATAAVALQVSFQVRGNKQCRHPYILTTLP